MSGEGLRAAAERLVNLRDTGWTTDSEQAAWAGLRAALAPSTPEPIGLTALGHVDGAHNHNAVPDENRPDTCGICGVGTRQWAVAAPSTPEPDRLDVETMRDILGRMHVGGRHPADLSWLAANGVHVLDALRAAPSTEPALDARPALLNIPLLNDALHLARFGLPRSRRQVLADFGLRDVERVAAEYARLAESEP